MDPLTTSVSGSRYPVCVPVKPNPPSPPPKPKLQRTSPLPVRDVRPVSAIRRKPVVTFKSPSSHDSTEGPVISARISQQSSSKPTPSSSIYSTSSVTESVSHSVSASRRRPIALPLYHPKGLLALSLPQLDPGLFGLPSPVSVDDQEVQEDEVARRPTSRARRPAAKVRDRERDEAEDNGTNGTDALNGQTKQTSPRKRRAGAGGGAGKRRRKDAEEADGTYPQPARRTRNARNANTLPASPLAGVAVAATDTPDNADTPKGADVEDTETPQAEVTKPNKRVTRPRPTTTKRRGSSASDSTTTSVSVSIATNSRNKSSVPEKAAEEPIREVEMEQEDKEEKVDEKTEAPSVGVDQEYKEKPEESASDTTKVAETSNPMQVDEPVETSVPGIPAPVENVLIAPPPETVTAVAELVKAINGTAAEDDKEEGELSESADGESVKKS